MRISPYLAFAKKSFLSKSAYRFDHFMGVLNTLMRIFIFWGIYLALYNGKSEVDVSPTAAQISRTEGGTPCCCLSARNSYIFC